MRNSMPFLSLHRSPLRLSRSGDCGGSSVVQRLMQSLLVVGMGSTDPTPLELRHRLVPPQVDVPVFGRVLQPLHEHVVQHRPLPSMLTATPADSSRPVPP